jgi:YVTN family beta-propeller protein
VKLKLVEAAVLLVILAVALGCDVPGFSGTVLSGLLNCDSPVATYTTCVSNEAGGYQMALVDEYPDGGLQVLKTLPDGPCAPSSNGEGGPQTSQHSADTVPNSSAASGTPGISVRPGTASARSARRNDAAGSGTTAGGFIGVGWLNLPFTPLAPSSPSAAGACDSSQPDVVIVDHTDAILTRLGTCPLAVKAKIALVSRPLQVVVTPDGTEAVVSNFDNFVSFVNLQTNTVIQNVATPNMNPSGVAISPDGSTAYVCSFSPTTPAVIVFNIATRSITATIPLNTPWPHSLALTPDGSQLYVVFSDNNEVDIIDTLTKTDFARLNIVNPEGIDFSPTGTFAYIASGGTNPTGSLLALDTKTLQVAQSYPVGSYPTDVRVTYGGSQVVVTNYLSNSISVFSRSTGQVTTTPVSGSPMGLARIQ